MIKYVYRSEAEGGETHGKPRTRWKEKVMEHVRDGGLQGEEGI